MTKKFGATDSEIADVDKRRTLRKHKSNYDDFAKQEDQHDVWETTQHQSLFEVKYKQTMGTSARIIAVDMKHGIWYVRNGKLKDLVGGMAGGAASKKKSKSKDTQKQYSCDSVHGMVVKSKETVLEVQLQYDTGVDKKNIIFESPIHREKFEEAIWIGQVRPRTRERNRMRDTPRILYL